MKPFIPFITINKTLDIFVFKNPSCASIIWPFWYVRCKSIECFLFSVAYRHFVNNIVLCKGTPKEIFPLNLNNDFSRSLLLSLYYRDKIRKDKGLIERIKERWNTGESQRSLCCKEILPINWLEAIHQNGCLELEFPHFRYCFNTT